MFDKMKRKLKGQVVEPDVKKPNYIVPEDRKERWGKMGYEAKDEILTFLNTLNRCELMSFADAKQFDGIKGLEDAVWEAYNDMEWERDWPLGKETYQERIPEIVLGSIPIQYKRKKDKNDRPIDLDLNKIVNQIEGMQKKLDRVETLISNAKFELCGKDALKL